MWLTLCGLIFLIVLVSLGLCREDFLTCLLVGGNLEGRGVLRFGRWCLFASFGVFGNKEILDVSRIWKGVLNGRYFSFVFLFVVSLDGGLFVSIDY
jgi:hypothetical protein